jgi:hypothetical protein
MFSFSSSGDFKNMQRFLDNMSKFDVNKVLGASAAAGVAALAMATPEESGLASNSWGVTFTGGRGTATITWTNTDVESGFPVAVRLQYGYGTGTGGYVQGRDYINPAMRPIFDKIADDVWRAVISA